MQNTKKALSVLLSILMVLTLVPWATVPAFAEDPEPDPEPTYAWSYDDETDTLTITGDGALPDFGAGGFSMPLPETPWEAYRDTAKKIVIGENITRVGDLSFTTFSELTEVVLPSTLTSIGVAAFAYCMDLATVNLPAGLTEIGEMAFGANSLTSVNIPAGVTTLDTVFSYNFAPLELTLNEGLETVNECFEESVIENLTIPSTVTSFSGSPLNVKRLVNNSAQAVVSDSLGSIPEDGLDVFFRIYKADMQISLIYLRTGEEPSEEDMYAFYLNLYNDILGTEYTDYFELIEALETGTLPPEAQERLESLEAGVDPVSVPLSTIQIFCLSTSAEHEALRANGYPHYIIDNDNALCTEAVAVKCGDDLTWTVDHDTHTLVITGHGDMYDEYKGWLFYRDEIENVSFVEDGGPITRIGTYAFRKMGALDTVSLPAGITSFGSEWLQDVTVGTISIPADFAYWDSYASNRIFNSNAASVGAFSVEAGNEHYFTYQNSLYGNAYGKVYLLSFLGGAVYAGTDVIREYAASHGTMTEVTIPASVSSVERYAFEYCASLSQVTIEPADHALAITLASFQYCDALSAFAVSETDTRFAAADGVLYTKDMTKLVAVPFTVNEFTIPATVTGIREGDSQGAYQSSSAAGIAKLTVLNPEFDFGYGSYSSNSAFTMRWKQNGSNNEVCGYSRSTAENFALNNGYTFTSLDGVSIESVVFDLSGVPATAYVNQDVNYSSWNITGTVTYSDGTVKAIAYGYNGNDFRIYCKYPNSNQWSENNHCYFGGGVGEYRFEARYGSFATPFSVTAILPDYHYEFDTSAAITEVKQFSDSGAYSKYNLDDSHILGVRLYKVYDDPERERELQYIGDCVSVYTMIDGESWSWTEILNKDVGDTFTVTFSFYKNQMTVEAQIDVTVIQGDFTIEFNGSAVPTTVEQFTEVNKQNWGASATLRTVSGNEYDVTAKLGFTVYDENDNWISTDAMDTTVPGTYSLRPYASIYGYYTDDALGEIYVPYMRFDPIAVTVTPSTTVDHIRLEVPETLEIEIRYSAKLTDYVKAYYVYADGTESEVTDKTGFRFHGENGNGGTYTGQEVWLYNYGESVYYTVSFADVTANMTVIGVQTIFYDVQAAVTEFEVWPNRSLTVGDFGLTVTRTKDGETAEITNSVRLAGIYDTYYREPGTYTAEIWYTDPDLDYNRKIGEVSYTLVNNISFEVRGIPDVITITQGEAYSLANAQLVKIQEGEETNAYNTYYWITSEDGSLGYGSALSQLPVGTYQLWFYGGMYLNGVYYSINSDTVEGNPFTIVVECAQHSPELAAAAVPATCYDPGSIAYWQCTVCGKYFSDEACTAEITLDDIEVPAIAHANAEYTEPNDPTCYAPGNIEYWYCPDCETYFADANFTDAIDLADTVIPGGHILEPHEGAQASCTEDGNLPYNECTRCHKLFVDAEATQEITDPSEIVLPAHHTLTRVAPVANTCTEAGNIEYWTCSACGEWFSDANGTAKIEDHGSVVLNAKNHSWGAWTKLDDTQHQRVCGNDAGHKETAPHTWDNGRVTQNPTCTAKGVKTFTCTACGATRNEDIATVGHKDENGDGLCDYNCGTSMGGGTPEQPSDPGQSSGEELCKYCHKPHTGFFGKIVGFFHNIAYFFAHLFGKM